MRKNPPPLPYKVQLMLAAKGIVGDPKPLRQKDEGLDFPKDDVYFIQNHPYRRFTMDEAMSNLRQIHDPTMLNDPDALVHIKVEFDMRATKKDRYLEPFSKMVPIVKSYDRNVPDRCVMCFVPNEELRLAAMQAGAVQAGGHDLIIEVSKGRVDISEIDHFVCHTDLAGQIRPLNAALRDKVPTMANESIGSDVVKMVQTFAKGMQVTVEKVKPGLGVADEPDYGVCKATIGRLGMANEDLVENMTAILEKLNENKPKRKDGSGLITRVQVYCLVNGSAAQNFQFSLIHPLIYDERVEEQEKLISEGRAEVAKNVEKLRESGYQ